MSYTIEHLNQIVKLLRDSLKVPLNELLIKDFKWSGLLEYRSAQNIVVGVFHNIILIFFRASIIEEPQLAFSKVWFDTVGLFLLYYVKSHLNEDNRQFTPELKHEIIHLNRKKIVPHDEQEVVVCKILFYL